MAKQKQGKRNVLDEVAEGVRQILDDLDRLVNPEKNKRVPVRVPVPVRIRNERPQDPYR
ncbi:MAG: hypothetical protein SF029_21720 [bacterium]|nr:hypothetical protein [bacterium]